MRPGHRVEVKHEGAVETFVGHDDVAAGRVEDHGVRMRRRLLHRIRPRFARQLVKLVHRQQPAIRLQRQNRHATTAVICDDQMPRSGIQWRSPTGLLPWDGIWLSSRKRRDSTVDGECADVIAAAMHGVHVVFGPGTHAVPVYRIAEFSEVPDSSGDVRAIW